VDGKSPKDPNVACEGSGTVRRRIEPEPSGNGSTTGVLRPMNDDREPIDVLYSIEKLLEGIDQKMAYELPDVRMNLTANRVEVLRFIDEHGPVSADEIKQNISQGSVTARVRELYDKYAVDREQRDGEYYYELSPIGERVANDHSLDEFSTESDGVDEQEEPEEADPWEFTPLTKSRYLALKAVCETKGNPKAAEANDLYCEYINADTEHYPSGARRIAGELSELNKTQYLNRAPNKPYRYWVTEEGKELLED